MKNVVIFILTVYLSFGILPTISIVVSNNINILKTATGELRDIIFVLIFSSCFVNALIFIFVKHCIEAAQYAKDHNVDIETAFEATSYNGDDD